MILASKSPRRKELLSLISKDFEVIVSEADETVEGNYPPEEKVREIATRKAKAVFEHVKEEQKSKAQAIAEKTSEDFVVIGCDTIVVLEGNIYGKPKDKEDAIHMLKNFSGKTHEVMSGLCMIFQRAGVSYQKVGVDITKVHVKSLTNQEIEDWLQTGKAWDKAGAYAIQEEFSAYIDKIEGNYASVMGLPVYLVYDFLKQEKTDMEDEK